MSYFSYKIEHDFGLAPNPFGGYCTLAVCKPTIRNNKNLQLGDWIIGTGSVKLNKLHHLIFAMKVEERITMEAYWDDPRFQYKKPVINGSLVQMYGDNFYYKDTSTKKWKQKDGAHSLHKGLTNDDHLKVDTGGKYVLISKTYFYFGDNAIKIPKRFLEVCSEGRNMKGPAIPEKIADDFISFLHSKYEIGIHGDPINWKQYLLKNN